MENTLSDKLRKIRKYRGLSLDAACDKIGRIVSRQALYKYEKGLMKPSQPVLEAILKAYGVDENSLYDKCPVSVRNLNFRYTGELPVVTERKLKADLMMMLEKYFLLEQLLADQIQYKSPLTRRKMDLTYEGMEKAASDIRARWNIGHDTIPSVCRMLEYAGIKVIEMELDKNIDGLCGWANRKNPFVLLNKNVTVERKRFTALHEFAHLLFPFSKEISPNQTERLCHRFASAFLLPLDIVRLYIGSRRNRLTVDELSAVRTNFGISIAATVHRLKDLSVISLDYYNEIFDNHIKKNRMEEGWGQYPLADAPLRYKALAQRACAEGLLLNNQLEAYWGDMKVGNIEFM